CDVEWDSTCAGEAAEICGGGPSDCYEANGTPGCDNAQCEADVCAADSFCCDTAWDQICADAAAKLCGGLCM
ncbi:MAG: hypothetical protein ACYTF9_01385, partial [Planctomycetota bacterium]